MSEDSDGNGRSLVVGWSVNVTVRFVSVWVDIRWTSFGGRLGDWALGVLHSEVSRASGVDRPVLRELPPSFVSML